MLSVVSPVKLSCQGLFLKKGGELSTIEANDAYRLLCLAYKNQRDSGGLPRHLPNDDT